jgi:hypothetical protein
LCNQRYFCIRALHLSPYATQADKRCAACGLSAVLANVVKAVTGDKIFVAPEGHGGRRWGLWQAVDDGDGAYMRYSARHRRSV